MAGEPTGGDITDGSIEADEPQRRWSVKMAVSAGVMALIIGGLAALAFTTIGGSSIAFVVAAIASGIFLYRKPVASAAIGTGLYISAALLVLTPILFYLPVIFGGGSGGAEDAGTFVGGILGLLIWGFVFFLIGLVVFTLGYFVNRRANRTVANRTAETEPSSR